MAETIASAATPVAHEVLLQAMTPAAPARIHLIPAKDAPFVVILRRKPSKLFHVIRWNTKTDVVEHGSWFHGKLYPMRCDVSFDGQWMVYLAMGASGKTWNGVCRLPFLHTELEGPNMGSWFGGGYWPKPRLLLLNRWTRAKGTIPFKIDAMVPEFGGEDLSVFFPRLARDGWKRRGDNYGQEIERRNAVGYMVGRIGDDGWQHAPSYKHPALTMRYVGYLEHGYTFGYALEEHPGLIDEQVDSACWDSLGNLIYARNGLVYKHSLKDLKLGKPGNALDLDALEEREA